MSKISKYSDYVSYFKSIALGIQLLNPNHVTDPDAENYGFVEFTDKFTGNNLPAYCMVLVPYKSNPFDDTSDNVMKRFSGDIWIIASVTRENDSDRKTKLDATEAIAEQVIAKMKTDNLNYELGSDRPIQMFDLNKVNMEQIGPIGNDLHYGWSIEFDIQNSKSVYIDTNLWW